MNHPYIASVYGYQSYLRLLEEAENYHQVKALRKDRPKIQFLTKIRQTFTSQSPLDTHRPVDTPA